MTEYVVENNLDERTILKAVKILKSDGLVAYPTDTSWGIGCSSRSKEGVQKLLKLKGDMKNITVTLICNGISQITEIAELDNPNYRFIKRYIPGPYVFILPALRSIEKKINMKRSEIGIRIPDNAVPLAIAEKLGTSLFSITASKKMTDTGWWDIKFAEENLFEYGYELEEIREIDLIIDTGEALPKILTTVIDLSAGKFEVVRHGIGEI
jgi:tRNA threonylcarbamoyl adenosine modification protein (Sua5/YciO/YrdC/YwlC family)